MAAGPPRRPAPERSPRLRWVLISVLVVLAVLLLVAAVGRQRPSVPITTPAAPVTTPTPTPTPVAPATTTTLPAGVLEVHFLDVGQGDATLLRSTDVAVLVDTGRHDAHDVVRHLRRTGIETLDLVAVTHPHADHLGQLDRVLGAVDVAEVWWSGSTHTTRTFERALAALEASDAGYAEPRAGDRATFGDLEVDVVNPPAGVDLDDLHDAGLALRFSWHGTTVLLTGDAETHTEERMVSGQTPLEADILQLGHHGSRTSTTPVFLTAVAPSVAVYSAGRDNPYGHPHREVVARLAAAQIPLYGTDVHGTIIIRIDEEGWTMELDNDLPPIRPGGEP